MDRVRRAAVAVLLLAASMGGASVAPSGLGAVPAAAVAWPPASLVLSELQTGGASASDEFVEIANQGPSAVDLVGLEVAYVTGTGSTVTRKATWPTSRPLAAGQRLLLVNATGAYAGVGDVTYSGGFAATGGALVLRAVGGSPVDSIGWGDATNAFVEGAAAPAPAAGSSLERRPGGAAGNGVDLNDNATDWFLQSVPSPQGLDHPPVPDPSASPIPSLTSVPSVAPSAEATPEPQPSVLPSAEPSIAPTPEPSVDPTPAPSAPPSPTATPTPTPTPTPTASPTPIPTPTATPTPSSAPSVSPEPSIAPPTPSPSTSPSPTPAPTAPAVTPIADARLAPDGTVVAVAGALTTPLGVLEDGRTGFVQDDTAGIAIHLDAPPLAPVASGATVVATGTVGSRFGQRTLRVALVDLVPGPAGAVPPAAMRSTGAIEEAVEGLRVEVAGATVGSPSALSDGTGLWVDDGTGQVRVIVTLDALGGRTLPAGSSVVARGPVGQRDSSGTGLEGYRIFVTHPDDLVIVPPPDPTASPEPSPSPSVSPSPSGSPVGSASPAPTASPSPSAAGPISIGEARSRQIGALVRISGVVTAEAGRVGTPPLVVMQDGTGGIAVRLPDGVQPPLRGARLTATGRLRDPYGQLEVRPDAAGLSVGAVEAIPAPTAVGGAAIGEATEGRLVSIDGVVEGRPQRASSGDVTVAVRTADGSLVRVAADASSGITRDAVADGRSYRLTGVVGQRASAKGRLDGYRLWLRGSGDIEPRGTAGAGPTGGGGGGSSPSPSPGRGGGQAPVAVQPVARALLVRDGAVRIEATVTASGNLLDSTGRRVVVEDASGAVEVLLPAGTSAPPIGARLRIDGTIGRAYGAPRLKATGVEPLGAGAPRAPLDLGAAPGAAHEWRLVRISGTIVDITKLGSRWRAELEVRGVRIPVAGVDGASIPVATLVEGRRATVVGIVRRAHPAATDRRFAIMPRSPGDLAVAATAGGDGGTGETDARSPAAGAGRPGATTSPPGPTDADLSNLEPHLGRTVRVGGLVVELTADGFELDDGTAIGRIVLSGDAAAYLPLIEPGDALNATGRVERRDDALLVRVTDPAGIARVGDPLPAPTAAPVEPSPDSNGAAIAPPGSGSAPRAAGLGESIDLGPSGTAGLVSLVLVSVASAAVTLLRRDRLRRQMLARVAVRLAAIGVGPADETPPRGAAGRPGAPSGGSS